MTKLYKILTFVLLIGIAQSAQAQILRKVGQKAEQRAKDRADRKIDQAIDKGLDKVENEIDSIGTKEKKTNKKNKGGDTTPSQPSEDNGTTTNNSSTNPTMPTNAPNGNGNGNSASSGNTPLKVDSKFDFVAGDKIVLLEDFNSYSLGDFPGKWITNGNGEVVQLHNEGRFLKVSKEAVFYPAAIKTLPDEFTLECDLMSNEDFNYYSYEFVVGLTNAKDLKTQWNYFGRFGHGGENNSRVEMLLHPNDEGNKEGLTYFVATHKTHESLRNNAKQNQLSVLSGNTKVHISIWRQKQRVRIYLNDKKVWDIPQAFEENVPVNSIYFRSNGTDNDKDAYFLSNIKLATGNPNTNQKLITEGKFSTSNILFDVNSDKIKPESYGTLKEIAAALNENTNVRIKIIGHTDSDGNDEVNLDLSIRRAAAVKKMLESSFNVNASRMEVDGKGEAQPLIPNTNPESKAQNRRVEFIKL
jgi:outer membrane protein OmpA-like peptidoglycan-associated protein